MRASRRDRPCSQFRSVADGTVGLVGCSQPWHRGQRIEHESSKRIHDGEPDAISAVPFPQPSTPAEGRKPATWHRFEPSASLGFSVYSTEATKCRHLPLPQEVSRGPYPDSWRAATRRSTTPSAQSPHSLPLPDCSFLSPIRRRIQLTCPREPSCDCRLTSRKRLPQAAAGMGGVNPTTRPHALSRGPDARASSCRSDREVPSARRGAVRIPGREPESAS